MVNRLTVFLHRLRQGHVQEPALNPVGEGIFGQIGVHHGRAAAHKHREVMRVDTFRRTHVERGKGPQPLADEVTVHRAGRKDHRHRDPVGPAVLIGQHQMARARAHGVFRLGPNPRQPGAEIAVARLKGAVDGHGMHLELRHQFFELRIADEGTVEHEDLGLGAVFVEHVLEVTEARLEAHHPEFAQGIDRRVGDLAKVLAEEVAQRAILAAQDRRGRVIAHRGQRLFPILGHGREDLFQLFDGIARSHLTAAQFGPVKQRLFGDAAKDIIHLGDLADPFAEGLVRRELVLDLGIVEEFALFHIDRDDLPRAKRAFAHDPRLVQWHHPGLGPGDQHAVGGFHIAHRAQAVPVKPGANPAAIGHRQCGGAVPWLHHGVAVGIHVAPCLGQFHRLFRPRFRHQHRLGHRRGAARADQHLEHGIQCGRVAGPRGHDRFDVLGHVAKGSRGHADLMALHPVHVALERVNLTVMGQHAEGLCQPPLREGVGGVALVIDREGADELIVFQVGIEFGNLFGQHHALVDDAAAGHRSDVHLRHLRGDGGFFDATADDIKLTLKCLFVGTFGVGDQDLLNLGPGRIGLFAQHGDVHRHMPPAVDVIAHAEHFGFHDGPAGFLRGKVGARQEDLAHGDQLVLARGVAGAADLLIKEGHRDLHVDARAIAGHPICVNRAAVPDRLERVDPVQHDLAGLLTVDVDHKAHAAGRMLFLETIHALIGHHRAFGFFAGHPGVIIFGHGLVPSTNAANPASTSALVLISWSPAKA